MSLEALSNIASLQLPLKSPTATSEMPHGDVGDAQCNLKSAGNIAIPPPPAHTRQTSFGMKNNNDWARQVSLEERLIIREKIQAAYRKRNLSVDDLLDTCSAIEEELLFGSAPSRLDYFKLGTQFEKRVAEKLSHKCLKSEMDGASAAELKADGSSSDSENNRATKRPKEGV